MGGDAVPLLMLVSQERELTGTGSFRRAVTRPSAVRLVACQWVRLDRRVTGHRGSDRDEHSGKVLVRPHA